MPRKAEFRIFTNLIYCLITKLSGGKQGFSIIFLIDFSLGERLRLSGYHSRREGN